MKKASFKARLEQSDRYRVDLRRGASTMQVVGSAKTVQRMLEMWLEAVEGGPLPTVRKKKRNDVA